MKLLPFVLVAASCVLEAAAASNNMDEVRERLSQRRLDLQQQGPLSKKEADYMKSLIQKRALRIANSPEDQQIISEKLLFANNPLAKAGRRNANNGRSGRTGGHRANERGASSTKPDKRDLGETTTRKGSKKGGGSSKSSGDSPSGPSVPELVPMVLEAFQDARMVQPPILTTPDATDLEPGTKYVFSNEPLFKVQLDSPGSHVASGTEGYFVDEGEMIATVSGTCTRTDPNTGDMYVGRAYCQYSYHFLDEFGNVEAGLVAEGVLQIGDYSTLSITGGSGIFRGTVGTIILESGEIGGAGKSATFVPDPMMDLPSSYLVSMFVFMDPTSLTGHPDIYY